jgi:6-phosphogluconolactonase (cycloisomerase 2 family)
LTLSSSGVLSGTPTQTGSFNFTIRATDASGCFGERSYSLAINCPPITLSPATLPDGATGVAYSQTLMASGGAAPYSFAVTAGALPGGLMLSSGGALSGTPNAAGAFNFTVAATDANGCAGTRSYTVNIAFTPSMQAGFLYVLNERTGSNQIYGYAVNETTGVLTLLSGFPISTGGSGLDRTPTEMLTIDRANQRLYAINDGSDTVSAYAINPTTGALTPLPFSPISLGIGSWTTIAVHPSGSPLVVGDGDGRLLSYQITAGTATAAAGSPYRTGSAQPFSTAFSQDGNYVYTGGNSGTTIAGFSVHAATGVLTALAGSPFDSSASFPAAYATDMAGRLFVGNDTQVRVFTTAGGILSAVSGNPFPSGLTSTDHGLLHPNGFYLVANRFGNRVGVYRIQGSGSATTLTAVAGSPFAAGGSFTEVLALNQAGTLLFAANGDSRNLTTFSVNAATGALAALNTQPLNTLGFSGRLTGMAYLSVSRPTITLSPAALPDGTIGAAYHQTISALPQAATTPAPSSPDHYWQSLWSAVARHRYGSPAHH